MTIIRLIWWAVFLLYLTLFVCFFAAKIPTFQSNSRSFRRPPIRLEGDLKRVTAMDSNNEMGIEERFSVRNLRRKLTSAWMLYSSRTYCSIIIKESSVSFRTLSNCSSSSPFPFSIKCVAYWVHAVHTSPFSQLSIYYHAQCEPKWVQCWFYW